MKQYKVTVSHIVGLIALGMLIFAAITIIIAPKAHADPNNYLSRLQANGYYGPAQTWLRMGYDICTLETRGFSREYIAGQIVLNTGPGIYTDEALNEIIPIAEQELCHAGGNPGIYA